MLWGMIIRMECMNKIVWVWVCGMKKQWSDDGWDMDVKCVKAWSVYVVMIWLFDKWMVCELNVLISLLKLEKVKNEMMIDMW